MKKIFAVVLAVLILLSISNVFAFAAVELSPEPTIVPIPTINPKYLPRPTPILNPPDEDDVIDFSRFEGKSFEEITNDFFEKWGINPDTVSFGYYNIITGEEQYYEGDKYMVAASVYKVPLNMYYTEQIYNGERSWDDTYRGSPYHAIQVSSIISSNNELSEALQMGVGDNNEYRAAIAYLLDVDPETVEEEYYNKDNKYTARQIIACLKKLYGNSHIYVNMEEYMLMGAPNSHFTAAEHRYVAPHKYGYLTFNGHNYYNDAAIIYTPHPFLLVMFTDNCAGGANTLTRFCTLMCDYSEYTRYLYEEAAKATPTPSPTPTPTPSPEETPVADTPVAPEIEETPEISLTPEATAPITGNDDETTEEPSGFSTVYVLLIVLFGAALAAAAAMLSRRRKYLDRVILTVLLIALVIALLTFIIVRA
ncbi:MAG: serine hydrolase [Oscillospiraceae bacterium]|nr:serine hydrolase [Oscillospiraceae bacterium]